MRFIKKITVVLMLCTLLIIPQTGCSNEEPVSENQFLLDTVCTLTVYLSLIHISSIDFSMQTIRELIREAEPYQNNE